MANRRYGQGVAKLGYQNGKHLVFRINPNEIDWNFQINTAVTETVGGRVVQVLGATISDLTIKGKYGQKPGKGGKSWELAESFVNGIKALADAQFDDAVAPGNMLKDPIVFSYPPKGWMFQVYIKGFTDASGQAAITHTPDTFSYDYTLTLSLVNDLKDTMKILGKNNGTMLQQLKDAAVEGYIARIADGIGWKISDYNGVQAAADSFADVMTGAETLSKKTG